MPKRPRTTADSSVAGDPAALASAMAAAKVGPGDRFEVLSRFHGLGPVAAMAAVLRSLPPGRRGWDIWPRVEFAAELMKAGLVDLEEVSAALATVGIHPYSLVGAHAGLGVPTLWPLTQALVGLDAEPDEEALAAVRRRSGMLRCSETLERLPEGIKLRALHLVHLPRLRELGEGLEIAAELRIASCGLLRGLPHLPDPLGRLSVVACSSFTHLPSSLRADRIHLADLPRLEAIALGPDFTGAVDIRNCPRLRRLELAGGRCGSLSLRETALGEPGGLRVVEGDLRLQGCGGIARLEGPLSVSGTLKLARLPRLHGLGRGIRIQGNLELVAMDEPFELAEDLEVGGQILVFPPCGRVLVPGRLQDKLVEIP